MTDAKPTWDEKLRQPFSEDLVFSKPRLWCKPCINAASKSCEIHEKRKCNECGQNMSPAHVHLDYVGHADVTDRLLEVDPYWYWTPAHHNVDKDLLLAAIATGNQQIVDSVIANAPPLLDEYGGMWITLTVHDDDGNEMVRLGYGDAEGKMGPFARKELIGDAIRNAAMRAGVALDLWSKHDRDEARAQEGKNGARKRDRGKRKDEPAPAQPEPAQDVPEPPVPTASMAEVQGLADLAWALADKLVPPEDLKRQVYQVALRKRCLGQMVTHPSTRQPVRLSQVLTDAKAVLVRNATGGAGPVISPTFRPPADE